MENFSYNMDNILTRSIYSSIIAVATLALGVLTYWLFYVPCNWKKQLNDVGYDIVLESSHTNKRDAINRLRRQRNVGSSELPPPFPNGWYSILESGDLNIGESKSVSCLGENFVVFRTAEGNAYVLDAYCPHMGANMGVGGRVIGDSIECPFHQWSFSGKDGSCVRVPYSSSAPQNVKVKKWISLELNDNIFVWYHMEHDANPWIIPMVKEIATKEMVYHGRNEFFVNCHIQEIPENGADVAHFTAIHNANVLAGGTNPKESALANAGTHRWEAKWKALDEPTKHFACVNLEHYIEFTPKMRFFRMDVTVKQIGPAYVQLFIKSPTMGHIIVTQTVTPIEPLMQKVVHRFYAPRILGPFMKFLVFGESIMFERDVSMWNHKTFRSNPKLVKEDSSIRLFRSWFLQFYSVNSKTFAEANEKCLHW